METQQTAAAPAPTTLETFFGADGVDLPRLSAWLDGLDPATRKAATVAMTPRQQARLYEAARGFRPLALEHFVPRAAAALQPVVHTGKNSIPLVSRFEKIFCSPEAGSAELW